MQYFHKPVPHTRAERVSFERLSLFLYLLAADKYGLRLEIFVEKRDIRLRAVFYAAPVGQPRQPGRVGTGAAGGLRQGVAKIQQVFESPRHRQRGPCDNTVCLAPPYAAFKRHFFSVGDERAALLPGGE